MMELTHEAAGPTVSQRAAIAASGSTAQTEGIRFTLDAQVFNDGTFSRFGNANALTGCFCLVLINRHNIFLLMWPPTSVQHSC